MLQIMLRDNGTGWASAVVTGCITGIALSAEWLPGRVASHFGANGLANGFVVRDAYLAFMIGLVAGLPALTGLVVNRLVRRPDSVKLPNRDYWLAPDRLNETTEVLTAHVAWLAAGVAAFVLGIHLLVIRANHFSPARLEVLPIVSLMTAFGIALMGWNRTLQRRFQRI
jgi:hypothetical protein